MVGLEDQSPENCRKRTNGDLNSFVKFGTAAMHQRGQPAQCTHPSLEAAHPITRGAVGLDCMDRNGLGLQGRSQHFVLGNCPNKYSRV